MPQTGPRASGIPSTTNGGHDGRAGESHRGTRVRNAFSITRTHLETSGSGSEHAISFGSHERNPSRCDKNLRSAERLKIARMERDTVEVTARFAYEAREADELSFAKDELFFVLEKVAAAPGWYVVERRVASPHGAKGQQGLAPGNYFKEARRVAAARVSARGSRAEPTKSSPRAEAVAVPLDDDADDGPPPPLPGPPPKWSDTIAGAAAVKVRPRARALVSFSQRLAQARCGLAR